MKLKKNNNKSIIDNTNDIILLISTDFKILTLNDRLDKAFKRFFGDRIFAGSNLNDLINSTDQIPKQFKEWQKYYDRVFNGEHFSFEEQGISETGGLSFFETEFNPVHQNGKVTGAAIFVRDITKRKQMEEEITRLNAEQQAIIDGANYSIISVGLDGLVSSFNRGSEKILGYSAEEAIGKLGPQDIISKKQLVATARTLSAELGRPIQPGLEIFGAKAEIGEEINEWMVTTKNGSTIILSSSITALRNEQGDIFRYLIISTDITDNKRADELLQMASEEDRNRLWINEGISEMSQLLQVRENDPVKFYTQVLTFVAQFGHAAQATLFRAFKMEKGEDALEQIAGYATEHGMHKQIYQFGESLIGQVAIERKAIELKNIPDDYIKIGSSLGQAKPSHIFIMPLVFMNELVGVVELASLRDFTLTESEFLDRANAVFASSIDLMNRRAKTDVLLKETLDMNERLKTQEEELRVGNEELMEKSNLLQASEEELRVQQGELIHLNTQMEEKANILEQQNETMSIKNVELETAREALKIKAEELEIISRYKSEFLANMSHELRTPLNSILILSKLLGESKDNPLTEKQVEFTKVIQRSGADLLNLISDILDLSKIESRKIDLEIESILIKDIDYAIDSLFNEMAKEKGIHFKINIEPGLTEEFMGDKVRTEQILKNLLSNSFKFTPRDGTIELNIFKAKAWATFKNLHLLNSKYNICFQVKDSGIGISTEKQQLIFEAFRQADGTTSRKYGGTGLGLSISKELALILGGELQLESEPGKGSSFTLFLPLVFDPESASENDVASNFRHEEKEVLQEPEKVKETLNKPYEKPTKTKESALSTARLKNLVLIIEDDMHFGTILKKQAEEKGFNAIIATRGDDGLRKILELLPDAILLDIGLPGMDGWTIMRQMKENPKTKDIPVHILSGGKDERNLGSELGAVEFLKKPLSAEQLDNVFEKMLNTASDKKRKALIIEDSEKQSIALRKILSAKGIECIVAQTGNEALDMISELVPDLLITDLNLPDIDGTELIKKVKLNADLAHINIIIYTDKDLSQKENDELSRYSDAIIIKSPKSEDRLLDETTLFLKKIKEGKAPSAKSKSMKSFGDEASLKGKKILLVDDDMRNIFALSKVLEEYQLDVVIANDGKEALTKLSENENVDLVLMDIMMPEMDGYEATAHIRTQDKYKKLPIIALTAKAMKGDREKSIEAGASDYISKPVDINKLMSLIRVWLS